MLFLLSNFDWYELLKNVILNEYLLKISKLVFELILIQAVLVIISSAFL